MRKLPAAPRALCVVLSAAVLWSSPGLAAHAAAAEIARPVEAAGLGVSAAIPAAPAALSLASPSLLSAPASASALSAAPLSAVPAAAALAAPAAEAAAAPVLPAAAAPSAVAAAVLSAPADEAPRAPQGAAAPAARPAALEAARAVSAPAADASWNFSRVFDGAASGLRRLVGARAPAPAALPALPGGLVRSGDPGLARAGENRATLLLRDPGSDHESAQLLYRLHARFGFRPDDAPVRVDGALRVSGSVPTEEVLALGASSRVLEVRIDGGAPEPEGPGRLRAAAARVGAAIRPARDPFVPATKIVADLEKLAANDPAKARALAMEYVAGGKESRREVKLAALRVLDAAPLAEIAPFHLKTLSAAADAKVQAAKADGKDAVWFVQRAILVRWAREASALKANADAVAAAQKAYADRNASVRLAAAAALRAMGVDPGPENEYLPAASMTDNGPFGASPSVDSEINAYPDPNVTVAPGVGKRLMKALGVGAVLAAVMVLVLSLSQPSSHSPAPAPSAPITRTLSPAPTISASAPPSVAPPAAAAGAPEAKADAASTDHELLEQIAKSEARIAKAQEDQVAAQKAAQQGGGFMSGIGGMIINAAIFIGLFALLGRLFKGFGGGASGGGMNAKTEAKSDVEKPAQRFTDIEGADESLVEVQEVVDFLRDPSRFARMGGKAPKGVLFEGPPGTGKTLMARAMAGETNSAFFAVSGSDFVELFVGMGARRVRELIQKAANNKPAIVFIDEIDAVGKKRGSNSGMGGDSEREQTINALLTAMDGFDNSGGIIFVAATNRADTLDPALLRPGRFDRKIFVGKPHMGGREAILTIHARDKRLAADVDLRQVARRTANLAGADLANVMNEAALLAIRRGADAIGNQDLDEAVDRGTIGAKRSLPMPEALKKRIAYHEAGHVLANMLNEDPEMRKKVNKFTIVPHGSGALGFAEIGDEEGDKYLYTKEELEARIDHALGGLVAEKLVYGKAEKIPEGLDPQWSTGPGSDLQAATRVARYMVEQLGMGASTGLAVTAPDPNDPFGRGFGGDRVAERNWLEVNKILAASYKRVKARLSRNRHVLEALTQAVLAKETLIGDEVDDVVRKAGPVDAPPAQP